MDTLISKSYNMVHLQLLKWYLFPPQEKKHFSASVFVS